MAAITGTTGNITGSTTVIINPFRWSADWIREQHNASVFGDEWDTMTVGLHHLSGEAEGWHDDTTAISTANFKTDAVAFVLTASTGRTYSFSGNFTSFEVTSATGELVRWRCSFESTATITVA